MSVEYLKDIANERIGGLIREAGRLHSAVVSTAPTSSRRNSPKSLSLSRAILAAHSGQFRTGAPEEWSAWSRPDGDPQRIQLRWGDLQTRDLSAGTAGAGGFLVSTATPSPEMPLVAGSAVFSAGARAVTGLSAAQLIPAVSAMPNFTWQPAETTQIPADSSITFNARAGTLKTGGIYGRVSHQLARQSNVDVDLRRILSLAAGLAIDRAALQGSGASGEPLGLLGTPGIGSVSGTSLAWAGVVSMEETVANADANDAQISFIAHPGTRKLLRQREKATGSGVIWPESQIAGHAAYATTSAPSATLFCGDFSNIVLLFWGEGPEILVDPSSGFREGRVDFGLFLSMDVVVVYPAAFSLATSIS